MRKTAFWVSPQALAMERVLQCVACSGLVSKVRVTTCSTWASVIWRGCPGRGESERPARRSLAKRLRHLPTVGRETRNFSATWPLARPSEQESTIPARKAMAWLVLRRRASSWSLALSSGDKMMGGTGRPLVM